jgi:hypothetical protein
MDQLRLFRVLISAQIALVVLSIAASVRLEKTLPETLQAYLRAQQEAPFVSRDAALVAAGIVLMAAFVVAWIALLRFWRIGPWFYLTTNVAGVVLTLAAGPTVTTAIETTLDTTSSVIAGAIIAMAFFSNVAVRFRATATTPP